MSLQRRFLDRPAGFCHGTPDLGVVPLRGRLLATVAFVEALQSLTLALLRGAFTLVRSLLALIGRLLTLVGDTVPFVGDPVSFVGDQLAPGLLGFTAGYSVLTFVQIIGAPVDVSPSAGTLDTDH